MGNGCAAGTAALETDMSALQSDIDAMQAKLAATLARFQDAQEDCAAIETEVVDEVCMQPTDPLTPTLSDNSRGRQISQIYNEVRIIRSSFGCHTQRLVKPCKYGPSPSCKQYLIYKKAWRYWIHVH